MFGWVNCCFVFQVFFQVFVDFVVFRNGLSGFVVVCILFYLEFLMVLDVQWSFGEVYVGLWNLRGFESYVDLGFCLFVFFGIELRVFVVLGGGESVVYCYLFQSFGRGWYFVFLFCIFWNFLYQREDSVFRLLVIGENGGREWIFLLQLFSKVIVYLNGCRMRG